MSLCTKTRWHILVLLTYVALVHLALAAVLLQPQRLLSLYRRLGVFDAELGDHYQEMGRSFESIDALTPPGCVVFIGDSLTQRLFVAAVTPNGINFGIGGDTTFGVLQRIGGYHCIQRARAVVLAVGVGDLRRRSNPEIIDNYRQILAKIPAAVPVVFSAVFPLDDRVRKMQRNERIRDLNAAAKQLAASFTNCRFLDSGGKLVDASGNLDARYHIGDGTHLSPDGYRIWIEDLKKALAEIEKNNAKSAAQA